MEFLAKSRIGTLLVAIRGFIPQSSLKHSGPVNIQSHASVLDARQIVGQSVAATSAVGRRATIRSTWSVIRIVVLDSLGQVKSENVDVTRMILVNGARFEQLMEHNGQLPSGHGTEEKQRGILRTEHEHLPNRLCGSEGSGKTSLSPRPARGLRPSPDICEEVMRWLARLRAEAR